MLSRAQIKGFTIIEIGIVLVIIGILIGGLLKASTGQLEITRYNQTLQKLQIIHHALESFVMINQRLPCPADASLSPTNTNYGVENCSGTLSAGVAMLPIVTPAIIDNTIIGGAVPYQTLMLPQETMFDGYGFKLTYVVSRGLTNINNGFDSEASGIIKINKYGAFTYFVDKAAYTLLSHGVTGRGAWNRGGSRISSGLNLYKVENSHSSGGWNETFQENLESLYFAEINFPKNAPIVFDDIVQYQTKSQILNNLGYSISSTACDDAYRALAANNLDANKLCGGNGGLANGTASSPYCNEYMLILAQEVKKRCLPRIQ
ncbi:hypothetical protein [Rickettsiales endosymbiont of Stachyamoeba lipophora]|uniref:hypothetical protein n=1 Tax=Rickettsiales endosymbiont of Stachyamoeba lipophora TaxID=2486578 RepID=UPI000F655654|nr:hypothetical protein [Rickettsiales endosymbiont of Stachyamoeba lipophora]AZL15820.1 hypothetical protein EF513_04580 [Rickettsiales endosymbiont of Stachyamoeba lipophora]